MSVLGVPKVFAEGLFGSRRRFWKVSFGVLAWLTSFLEVPLGMLACAVILWDAKLVPVRVPWAVWGSEGCLSRAWFGPEAGFGECL